MDSFPNADRGTTTDVHSVTSHTNEESFHAQHVDPGPRWHHLDGRHLPDARCRLGARPARAADLATKYDEITTPYASTLLTAGPGATVQNITIQSACPIDFSDDLSMSFGPRISAIVRKALTPSSVGWVPCLPKASVQ